jgi:hypothetical protein
MEDKVTKSHSVVLHYNVLANDGDMLGDGASKVHLPKQVVFVVFLVL